MCKLATYELVVLRHLYDKTHKRLEHGAALMAAIECLFSMGYIDRNYTAHGIHYTINHKGRMAILLHKSLVELRHCNTFIASKEKMHPNGLEIHDELIKDIEKELDKDEVNS